MWVMFQNDFLLQQSEMILNEGMRDKNSKFQEIYLTILRKWKTVRIDLVLHIKIYDNLI